MTMGAQIAEAHPEMEPEGGGTDWIGAAPWEEAADPDAYADDEVARAPLGIRLFAGLLILAAFGWIGAAGYALWQAWPGPSLQAWVGWAATVVGPLILIGLLWLIFGKTSRREARRFTVAVAAMRRESEALEGVLAAMTARLSENRALLGEEAARLMSLGDEASERLARATGMISRETAELDRKAQALDEAAATALVDIGVLMSDLPRAETQARAAAEALRQAGLGAHEQAGALDTHLAALTARGREADEAIGGAAQRLGAHIARIETGAEAAAARMGDASAQMNAAVDGAMARAAESVDRARAGLEAQGQTMLAMIEQSRAAFEQAGAETTKGLAERLDLAAQKIEMMAGRLATQDAASRALIGGLSRQLGEIEAQIEAIGRGGDEQGARLTQSMEALGAVSQMLQGEIAKGSEQAGEMIDRTHELAEALAEATRRMNDEMPPAMTAVKAQAEETAAAADGLASRMEVMRAAAADAAEITADSEASIGRQRESLDALLGVLREGAGEAEEKLRALSSLIGDTDGAAGRLTKETGPELIEALVRVREAANQAANHAREAIAAVIPESVDRLAEAGRAAMSEALTDPVNEQIAELGNASHLALTTAKAAGERLTRQLLAIGETAATIEERIAENRAEQEERAAATLSRQVTLLIDALNSTAIDVTKILSNEANDEAWAAYLKGDRGIFTRRAVRLIESGEAREILRHYEEEPDFRDQVNRYIHDFEAMLRRVLADRDGTPLGITLLSSDMGKLYVALAQAIERLRK